MVAPRPQELRPQRLRSDACQFQGLGCVGFDVYHRLRLGAWPTWRRRRDWFGFTSLSAQYVCIAVADQTLFRPTHIQTHPGEALPQLAFDQDNKTILHSLQLQSDIDGHVFGEYCCNSDKSGVPKAYGKTTFTLKPDVATVLQFESGNLRPSANITSASLKFETTGTTWAWLSSQNGGLAESDLYADATFDIRTETTAYSMPRRAEKNDVDGRLKSKAFVRWAVPVRTSHSVVSTPDLTPLLTELQASRDWSEKCTISFIITPADDGSIGQFERI